MNRAIKSVFVLVLAAGLTLVSTVPASALGGTGGTTTNGIGCCRVSAFH